MGLQSVMDQLIQRLQSLQMGRYPRFDQPEFITAPKPRLYLDENVKFTVFLPKVVAPELWYDLLAFAHLTERRPEAPPWEPDPLQEVKRQAEQILAGKFPQYQDLGQYSTQAIPQEGELTFLPEISGFDFNPPRRTFLWQESVHREEFRFRAPRSLDGQFARGRLTVFLGCIIVSEIPLVIKVDSREATEAAKPPLQSHSATYFRNIFASYSHKDRPIVEAFEEYAKGLGDKYMRDLIDLRAGEEWTLSLMEKIRQAHIFQLFWSSNSMYSPFVRQEWQYALSLQRPYFVRPVYWEDPMPTDPARNLPPEELQRLHFARVYLKAAAVSPPITPELFDSFQKRTEPREYRMATRIDGLFSGPGFFWGARKRDEPPQRVSYPRGNLHYAYDLFISYARQDNERGQVTELKEQIEANYRAFAGQELRCFFDLSEIKGMDDWQHRILGALQGSHLLLLVLSPNYLNSKYCRWEVVEYLKYVHARAVGGEGVAPVYFVTIPGLGSKKFEARAAQWVKQARLYNHVDLRPWYNVGRLALRRHDVRRRLAELQEALQTRLDRLRRAAAAPGNLPAANPHFVGRVEEMRRLHEATALGQVGLISALHGLGGLGKTALALQYAYAYADFYPGGRWLLNCVGAEHLAGLIRRLHVDLGIDFTEAEALDDDLAARRVLRELEELARDNAAARTQGGKGPQPRPSSSWTTWTGPSSCSRRRATLSPAKSGSGSWPPPAWSRPASGSGRGGLPSRRWTGCRKRRP